MTAAQKAAATPMRTSARNREACSFACRLRRGRCRVAWSNTKWVQAFIPKACGAQPRAGSVSAGRPGGSQHRRRPSGLQASGLQASRSLSLWRGRARSAPPPPPWPELHPRPTPLASRASGRRAPGQGQGQTFGRWASSGSGRAGARLRADSAGGWLGWEKARDSPDQGVGAAWGFMGNMACVGGASRSLHLRGAPREAERHVVHLRGLWGGGFGAQVSFAQLFAHQVSL